MTHLTLPELDGDSGTHVARLLRFCHIATPEQRRLRDVVI